MQLLKNHFSLALLTLFALILSLFRVTYSNQYMYLFLIWNLFLAYLPLGFGELYLLFQEKKIRFVFLFLWMLFLPNSFYILTDLFHLQARHPIPKWYDLLLILSFAFSGMMVGFLSMNRIIIQFKTKQWIKQFILPIVILFLSSFGIYLGRFLRWNSWDILTTPHLLLADIIKRVANPLNHPTTTGVTLGLGLFLYLVYQILNSLRREN